MADKPIKLTDAQLTTLQQVKLPDGISAKLRTMLDIRWGSTNLSHAEFESINTYGLVKMVYRDKSTVSVMLTDLGRAYLLQPPPKTDAARIAELEAALRKIYDDVNYWFVIPESQEPRDLLAGIEWDCTLGLYGKAPHELGEE